MSAGYDRGISEKGVESKLVLWGKEQKADWHSPDLLQSDKFTCQARIHVSLNEWY